MKKVTSIKYPFSQAYLHGFFDFYFLYRFSQGCINQYMVSWLIFIFCTELAQAVVDARTVPLLVLCIQEPELSLKRIAASALSEHSPELAQTVVNAGAIAHLAQMILNPAKLKVGHYRN